MDKAAKNNQREAMRSIIEQRQAGRKSQFKFYAENQITTHSFITD